MARSATARARRKVVATRIGGCMIHARPTDFLAFFLHHNTHTPTLRYAYPHTTHVHAYVPRMAHAHSARRAHIAHA